MRYSELRLLRWANVNLATRNLTVGQSKAESGTGRLIPLHSRAYAILSFWAGLFPGHPPEHYVFRQEKYGLAQRGDEPKGSTMVCLHGPEPAKPIGCWKEAWKPQRSAPASLVASTICDIRPAHGC